MLLTDRCVRNTEVWVTSFFFGRNNVKTSFVQTGKVALNTRKQSVLAEDRSQRERRSECIFLSNVRAHQLYIGADTFWVRSVGCCFLVVREECIVRCVALMVNVSHCEVKLRTWTDRQCVGKVGRDTVGTDILCAFWIRVQEQIILHIATITEFVHCLCAKHELIVLCKRTIHVDARTNVVHKAVNTVRDLVFMFHLVACKSVLCRIDGIFFRTLCCNQQTNVLVAHRTRALVALVSEVAILNVCVYWRFEGWFLWNNVDGSSNCAAAIESRTCTLNHFKTVYVVRTHLLQAVNTCKTRVHGFAIEQHLCVFGTKTLHTNHWEVAELALLFYTNTRHSFQCIEEVQRILALDRLRRKHFRTDRNILYKVFGACTCYHNLAKL